MSSKTDQPRFDGFDYVTDGGDSVPTRFDRDLSRALRSLDCVSHTHWFSRVEGVYVSCEYPVPSDVIETVGKLFDERPADINVANSWNEGKELLICPDR